MFHRRRQTRITREGYYFLLVLMFVLGGAVIREINLMLLLAGMMLGPLLFSWRWVVVSLRSLEVSRKLPEGVCAGDLLVVEVAVSNLRRRTSSWALAIDDQIKHDGAAPSSAIRASVLLPHVPPGQTRRISYQGKLEMRGLYHLGPLKITTRFPFGLLRRSVDYERGDTVVVYPRLGQLGLGWLKLQQMAVIGQNRGRRRQGLTEGDFYGLREWRPGDNKRWIHWRTSARRGGLMVRQFEPPRSQDLAMFVELWQPPTPTHEDLERVELTASFAATVAAGLCRRGGSQLITTIAGQEITSTKQTASLALLPEIMTDLGLARATSQDRLPEAMQRCLDQIRPGMQILVVSTRPTQLDDAQRFARIWNDPRQRAVLTAMNVVDVGSPSLGDFFRLD